MTVYETKTLLYGLATNNYNAVLVLCAGIRHIPKHALRLHTAGRRTQAYGARHQ